jgi:hypothetical protein
LTFPKDDSLPMVRWFGWACTVEWQGEIEVRVSGVVVSRFDKADTGMRNMVLAQLAATGSFRLGELAAAFGITAEGLRRIRLAHAEKGLAAMGERRRGGSTSKLPARLRSKLEAAFARGLKGAAARATLSRSEQSRISESYVRQLYAAYKRRTPTSTAPAPVEAAPATASAPSASLALFSADERRGAAAAATCEAEASPTPAADVHAQPAREAGWFGPVAPGSGLVQHAGCWLLLGMLARDGLYEAVEERCATDGGPSPHDARLAIDAFASALAIGEGCAEGVRRLATPSGASLLCASDVPSPWWVRKTLGQLADTGALLFHLAMAGRYARAGLTRAPDEPAVFYIDNHLRPYTGQEVLRRGWRMQARKVVPGTSDYWVHDVEGRPLFRREVPEHGSLTEQLAPAAEILRMALGDKARILLAFDRGGAFPTAMAGLRDLGFELATYERGPYQELAAHAFVHKLDLGDEVVRYVEAREKNLGRGRGRVRRICARGKDGHQYNILGTGPAAAEVFVRVMAGRWGQENSFRHGGLRWHLNHLDARGVEHYDPATIVPNPARRRLDHDLRVACIVEGDARRQLARLTDDDARRDNILKDIADAEDLQRELLERRARTPSKAPLAETELAGKLVHHRPGYKLTLDTVRVACHNVESELAAILAEQLPRPREAKKLLASLFAAPGHAHAHASTLRLQLLPAASADEHRAIDYLCSVLNRRQLRLPGDPLRRRLLVGSQH